VSLRNIHLSGIAAMQAKFCVEGGTFILIS